MAYLTNFSFELVYKFFTQDAPSTSHILWCKKVKNDQKLKSRGGPALNLFFSRRLFLFVSFFPSDSFFPSSALPASSAACTHFFFSSQIKGSSIFPDDSFSLSHSFLLILFPLFCAASIFCSMHALLYYPTCTHTHTHARSLARARTHIQNFASLN